MRAFALLLLVAVPAVAQPVVPPAAEYAAAVANVRKLVEGEVKDKRLPALSIALVDDQRVVWAEGFGFRDRAGKEPATAETVYRVGSVSKLFTDVAVMQLVEAGTLDLDKPVSDYVPDFKPAYRPGQKPVTLRMLMAHRSGLVREPPVGNYFDNNEPTLAETVASLNGIEPVYDPGTKTKYSNGGIGLVGYTLEYTQRAKFETYVQRRVLDVLGMKSSSFMLTKDLKAALADATMWTYHGREFPAPTFEFGMAPAGCMYSTVLDLAKFHSCLFAHGKLKEGQLVKPETLAEMLTPQFTKDGQRGFGLGFIVGDLDGKPRIGHGGAVYGFATEFAALPGEKLGVVVVTSKDTANAVCSRIANEALRQAVAAKAGKELPTIKVSEPLPAAEAKALAGRYHDGNRGFELIESAGRLRVHWDHGLGLVQLRKDGDDLIADDLIEWGTRYVRDGDAFVIHGSKFARQMPARAAPAEPPARWAGLIGEYGWDHNTLYIYERDGVLHALVEWSEIDPLTEESETVFAFPEGRGMYHGEKFVFTRDKAGRATSVEMAKVRFERRKVDGENGETFKVAPAKPLDELRKAAMEAKPPEEVQKAELLPPDLFDLAKLDGVKFDVRYATANNFLGAAVYSQAKAYLQRPAADALAKVQAAVKAKGYGLLVFDAYRPWAVTKLFWDATPAKFHDFVADPAKGSRHNRGCAVDLGLYDLATGKPVAMPSGYDEFSDRAYADYPGGTSRQRWHRDLLRQAMEAEGFAVYAEEWWHFDHKDWKKYPILNVPFEQLP